MSRIPVVTKDTASPDQLALLDAIQAKLGMVPNFLGVLAQSTDALTALNETSCVLMLLDLNLPDKNGLDLITEIRAGGEFTNIRILAMSGVYRREDDAMDAIRAGADAFISKSFRPDDLRAKVKKLLAG